MGSSKKKTKKPVAAKATIENKAAASSAARTPPSKIKTEEIEMTTHKAEKFTAEAAFLNKEQMDAFMQCGTLWMKGTEDIVKTCVSLTQDAVEKNTEAVKSLMGCKTLNELTETQTKLVQESFDDLVANATKLSEMSVRLATNSFEPINAQFSKTLKKASDRAAA